METAPTEAGFSAERLDRITEHLQRNYIGPAKIGGCQVAVTRHGHLAYFESLGLKDSERAAPMADDTIFRIYSMTKPITSIALMQLYERGMFQLDDPVYRAIPSWREQKVYVGGEGESLELAPPESPMTFRHLLTHTAGLSYGATQHPVDKLYRSHNVRRDEGETLSSFVDKLSNVPLHFTPGSRWMYSYATDICGHLVEVLSGLPLDVYFEENVFGPLSMRDTAFHVSEDKLSRFASSSSRSRFSELAWIPIPIPSFCAYTSSEAMRRAALVVKPLVSTTLAREPAFASFTPCRP